jgi:SAM-dependent methyltransferase
MRVGALKARQIREAVANAGTSIDSLGAILDFGCGCGRVARHWKDLRGPELHGTDYDPELVGWCRDNLPFLQVHKNELEPPTQLPAGRFDLVYVISILTHLPEELGRRWLEEWGRILRPGGLLLFTTHGDVHRRHLSRRERLSYDAGEVVVKNAGVAGSAVCMAHHPRSWVDANLPPGFEVVSFTPGAPTVGFLQDMHLLRRVA